VRAEELDERTSEAATVLAGYGLRPGDRLLWSLRPSVPSAVACLAALRLGAVVVPVNPSLTSSELAYVVEDVAPVVAVVDSPEVAGWLSEGDGRPPGGSAPVVLDPSGVPVGGGGRSAARPAAGHEPDHEPALDAAGPDDPALIVYTSGTTGRPKGAVLSHGNLAAGTAALRLAWDWSPDDRLVLALPLFHVHGLCAGLMGTLSAGASAVLVSPFDPGAVAEACSDRSTLFFGVPTMYHRLLAQGASALGRLRLAVSGSAPLAPALWHRLRDEAGVEALERYGMTETLLTLSNPLVGERRPGTVGFPLPGVEVRIGESEAGDGELLVRGPSIFGGYWQRPAATADAFDGAWFKTGDIAGRDADGYYAIKGRQGDMLISGGHNVYPAEVEDVLLQHPAVAEVAVVGTPSEEWGEAVTAYVVAAATPFPVADVEAFAAERLSGYKRPRLIRVVESLPRNAMGKVRRDVLR
jgi:acyl-CoA synthetase (AMP-forming)/AMP-acid ligase II